MKEKLSNRIHTSSRGKKVETAQLAAQLAPLEERDRHSSRQYAADGTLGKGANQEHGAIVVDSNSLSLPKAAIEGQDEKNFLGIEPVVLVILGVMLTFIAFIAWQISLMAEPGR